MSPADAKLVNDTILLLVFVLFALYLNGFIKLKEKVLFVEKNKTAFKVLSYAGIAFYIFIIARNIISR